MMRTLKIYKVTYEGCEEFVEAEDVIEAVDILLENSVVGEAGDVNSVQQICVSSEIYNEDTADLNEATAEDDLAELSEEFL